SGVRHCVSCASRRPASGAFEIVHNVGTTAYPNPIHFVWRRRVRTPLPIPFPLSRTPLPQTPPIGAHTIDNGGIHHAALRAGNAGMTALQIFTAIPKYYGDKSSIRPERAARFRQALETAGIEPRNVVVHAAYVLNT